MVLRGKSIRGDESLYIGLVDHLVAEEDFFTHVDAIAREYLEACSMGMRVSKLVLNETRHMEYDAAFPHYLRLQERAHFSRDAAEAKRAYLEKHDPVWG